MPVSRHVVRVLELPGQASLYRANHTHIHLLNHRSVPGSSRDNSTGSLLDTVVLRGGAGSKVCKTCKEASLLEAAILYG
jgi:hypothetical protein